MCKPCNSSATGWCRRSACHSRSPPSRLAAALTYAGEIHATLAGPSLVALGAALIGMWLGQLVRGKVRAETFRLCFFLGLLLLGAHLALRGLI